MTPERVHMPVDRQAITHKFEIGELEGYFTVGLLDDGSPGELFIKASKVGSIEHGLLDAVGLLTSLCLQYGVPLEVVVNKLSGTNFQPNGWCRGKYYKSLLDYIFSWVGGRFAVQKPIAPIPVNGKHHYDFVSLAS